MAGIAKAPATIAILLQVVKTMDATKATQRAAVVPALSNSKNWTIIEWPIGKAWSDWGKIPEVQIPNIKTEVLDRRGSNISYFYCTVHLQLHMIHYIQLQFFYIYTGTHIFYAAYISFICYSRSVMITSPPPVETHISVLRSVW